MIPFGRFVYRGRKQGVKEGGNRIALDGYLRYKARMKLRAVAIGLGLLFAACDKDGGGPCMTNCDPSKFIVQFSSDMSQLPDGGDGGFVGINPFTPDLSSIQSNTGGN